MTDPASPAAVTDIGFVADLRLFARAFVEGGPSYNEIMRAADHIAALQTELDARGAG